MGCWIDSYPFKEDAISSHRGADTSIKDVSLKGTDNPMCNLKQGIVVGKLVGPHQYRESTALGQGR